MSMAARFVFPTCHGSEVGVVSVLDQPKTIVRIRPETVEDLAAAITAAVPYGKTFEITGGATKLSLGNPVSANAVLDLSGLSGAVFYEPEELVLKVHAGTPLAEVREMLAERQQHLAFDPPDYGSVLGLRKDGATIGGVVACNIAGPRRLLGGTPRDVLLGVEGVNGRGEHFKAGGRTVKNVTGYDLPKLMAGSHGVLAVLTTLTLKVAPRPQDEATLLLSGQSEAKGVEMMLDALRMSAEVSGAAHLPARQVGVSRTALRLEGSKTSVDARLIELEHQFHRTGEVAKIFGSESAAFWREVRDLDALAPQPDESIWRLLVPATQAARIAAAVGGRALYDWGGSQIFVAMPTARVQEDAASIRSIVGQVGGRAILFRAPDAVRRRVGAQHPSTSIIEELSERTRRAFDPSSVLNPGRLGRINGGAQ
jgi:glycolate oxidase FAD binding subunit